MPKRLGKITFHFKVPNVRQSEFGEIMKSFRYSNECENHDHIYCAQAGYITQSCMAGRVGFISSYVCDIERGKLVSFVAAHNFCQYLGLNVDDYVDSVYVSPERAVLTDVLVLKKDARFGEFRDRFGYDVAVARKSILCENGCCVRHVSVHHAAKMFGLTGSTWQWIEGSKKDISFELFLRICEALGLNPRRYTVAREMMSAGNSDAELMSWLAANKGRVAFGIDGDLVRVFVEGYTYSASDTLAGAVSKFRNIIDGERVVA